MAGFAYPEVMVSVVEQVGKGDRDSAQDLFDACLPLARFEQQPGMGLAIRKYAVARRGIIAHDALRRPGAPLSAISRADIDWLIARQEKRLEAVS